MELSKEETYVLELIVGWGFESIYCYFNNKKPYNCLAKKIRVPANADTNGLIWICEDCTTKLIQRLRDEHKIK